VSAPSLLVGGLLAIGAGLVGAALVRIRIARRLRPTIEAVDGIGRGEPDARAPIGAGGELGELAEAVNRMATRLREQARTSNDEQGVRDLILSSMQEGVALVEGGAITFSNTGLERHLRSEPPALARLLPPAIRDVVEAAASSRDVASVEAETGAPVRWLRATAVPVSGRDAVLLVVTDVTEAKRLEAVRRDFVANASHELKTPAASIQAMAETIQRATVDDPAVLPRFSAQLEREATRLSRIVADLLDLSRLETGSDLAELVRLDALVREEVGRFEQAASGAGVALEVDAAPVTPVRGSPRDLALLARNLIDNAIRYTKPGGRVEIAVVEGADGAVALKVADTGVGIPSRELPRIFERFYRVDLARSRETGGTGLGLAIVRHVTENHGGTVTVHSELGRGTRFEVRIPRAEGAPRPEPSGSAPQASSA
jgi:signal transduction histidine kinase/HAMP domain-containing protein